MNNFVQEISVPNQEIDSCYSNGGIKLFLDAKPPAVNSFINLRGESDDKATALLRHLGENRYVLRQNSTTVGSDIRPKGLNQGAFCDVLTNPSIPLNVCLGSAGTGKTTLALAYALERTICSKAASPQKLILSKPAVTVGKGRAFGPVPGDMNEKYAPYLESFTLVIKKILGRRADAYFGSGKRGDGITYMPTELMRGCTFDNSIIIVDEFQNLSWHELNTLISRVGDNSKLILLGDPSQVDVQFSKGEHAGVEVLLEAPPFSNSPLSSVTQLKTVYRSPICALASDINDHYRSTLLKV